MHIFNLCNWFLTNLENTILQHLAIQKRKYEWYFHLGNISRLYVETFSKRRDMFVLWWIRDEYDSKLNNPMIVFSKFLFSFRCTIFLLVSSFLATLEKCFWLTSTTKSTKMSLFWKLPINFWLVPSFYVLNWRIWNGQHRPKNSFLTH